MTTSNSFELPKVEAGLNPSAQKLETVNRDLDAILKFANGHLESLSILTPDTKPQHSKNLCNFREAQKELFDALEATYTACFSHMKQQTKIMFMEDFHRKVLGILDDCIRLSEVFDKATILSSIPDTGNAPGGSCQSSRASNKVNRNTLEFFMYRNETSIKFSERQGSQISYKATELSEILISAIARCQTHICNVSGCCASTTIDNDSNIGSI
ncbi:hypothetical protein H4219_005290 [Mycoemilia scoparia]|uniref:Uncharacterized protein n=1 Tax=Mycoemilia scoparia TaxID=417184 RepID=A0A9W7ZNI9_9FUNG|nr:hypothetical protein H4219_005290 [Mycoemilia scoparia]